MDGLSYLATINRILASDVENGFLKLSDENIAALIANGNSSNDWTKVRFSKSALAAETISKITRCTFTIEGDERIFIDELIGQVVYKGIFQDSGLHDSQFSGYCFLSKNCSVQSSLSISNSFIGEGSLVIGCGWIGSRKKEPNPFGLPFQITIGPETGGREITVNSQTTFLSICHQVYRKGDAPTSLEDKLYDYQIPFTIIGNYSSLDQCPEILNCYIGNHAQLFYSLLRHSYLLSTRERPVIVSNGANITRCLIGQGCLVESNCHLTNVYMSEASHIGINARVVHSVLSPDASVEAGECHHSLVGPFIGFHHHSLLIATLWPLGRGNVAYGGKCGANHTGRMNDQECWLGEGIFLGLNVSLKFPINLVDSPYSIIAPGTTLSPQIIRFPFSLISTLPSSMAQSQIAQPLSCYPDCCLLKPGWIIYGNPYMIER
jgi:hypothetical protein